MLSIYTKLRDLGKTDPVVIDAADTDVFTAAAHVAHLYNHDLFIKRKEGFADCKQLVNRSMVNSIIPLHVMTGCDATSGFFGKGKSILFNKVYDSERAQFQLQHCGGMI